MKRIKLNRTFWRSIISVFIVGVFVWFAFGSIGSGRQQKRHVKDNIYEIAKFYGNGNKKIIQGPVDEHGNWHGNIVTQSKDFDDNVTYQKEVEMVNGLENGVATIWESGVGTYYICYDMGYTVDCQKSAQTVDEEISAFEILSRRHPDVLLDIRQIYGLDDAQAKELLDEYDVRFENYDFSIEEFDEYYETITENIYDETELDTLIDANAEISFYKGIELSQFDEFRYAVHTSTSTGLDLYHTIKNFFSNYLNSMNDYEIPDESFELFCHIFDSLMTSYGPLELSDPDLIDSLDNRMFRALDIISTGELFNNATLKSLKLNGAKASINYFLHQQMNSLMKVSPAATPDEVANLVIGLVLLRYIEGDRIRTSLQKSYSMKNGIIQFPAVTTVFQSRNSSSGVTIAGNVIDNGGGDIITRGFVWGTGFNPDYRNNVIAVDPGTGSFSSEIKGLSEDTTYYVRSFATNAAGTQYGNCVKFSTKITVSAEVTNLDTPELSVFPNPSSGITTFRYLAEESETMMLSIISINGQIVMQKELKNVTQGKNRMELDLTHLEDGLYTARITVNNLNQVSRKFVIAH